MGEPGMGWSEPGMGWGGREMGWGEPGSTPTQLESIALVAVGCHHGASSSIGGGVAGTRPETLGSVVLGEAFSGVSPLAVAPARARPVGIGGAALSRPT